MSQLLEQRSELIIDRLEKIIAAVSLRSPTLSLISEITIKLIPAIAIALLITYLILFDRSLTIPTNTTASVIYSLGVLIFRGCVKSIKSYLQAP